MQKLIWAAPQMLPGDRHCPQVKTKSLSTRPFDSLRACASHPFNFIYASPAAVRFNWGCASMGNTWRLTWTAMDRDDQGSRGGNLFSLLILLSDWFRSQCHIYSPTCILLRIRSTTWLLLPGRTPRPRARGATLDSRQRWVFEARFLWIYILSHMHVNVTYIRIIIIRLMKHILSQSHAPTSPHLTSPHPSVTLVYRMYIYWLRIEIEGWRLIALTIGLNPITTNFTPRPGLLSHYGYIYMVISSTRKGLALLAGWC